MTPFVKVPVKFGVIGAAVITFIFLVYYFTGSNPLVEMDMIDIFILPVFLFFGIKEFRDVHNNGMLEFWQGMTAGFLIYSLIALLSSSFILMFIENIDTSLAEGYIADRLQILAGTKEKIIEEMGEASYMTTVSQVGNTSTFDMALDGFLKKMAIGFLLTSVISVVMKRKIQK